MAERYGSYVLVGKNSKEKIIIDWTKIQQFSKDKSKQYKLERIDYFTSHFLNREELLDLLLKTGIVTPEQAIGMSFWIYPASQSVGGKKLKEPKLAPDHLDYGVPYKRVSSYLTDDAATIAFLQSKLNDFDFIEALYNKYADETHGKYGKRVLNNLNYLYDNEDRENIRKGLLAQLIQVREQNSLLGSIYAYSQMKKNGEYIENELYESVRNNIREFYLREVYSVIGCRDGLNDNRELTYAQNKDGSYKQSYTNKHNLVMFICKKILDEEREILEQEKIAKAKAAEIRSNPESQYHKPVQKHTIKRRRKNEPVEGQMTLFDLFPETFTDDDEKKKTL